MNPDLLIHAYFSTTVVAGNLLQRPAPERIAMPLRVENLRNNYG